jgi:hypothetical protein
MGPIHNNIELQAFIQMHNMHHFGQAHGTPFTIPPLDGIQWQANLIEAKELIEGTIPITFLSDNPFTQKSFNIFQTKNNNL